MVQRGFTFLELASAVAITASLAALALPIYGAYLQRAQLSQLLLHVDQIGTAVRIEDASGVKNLQAGAEPGHSPAQLQAVPDSAFNDAGGIRLLLIRAPAGTFASWPDQAAYGLIADMDAAADSARLRNLRHLLPFDSGDKLWLAANQLAFPLLARGTVATPAPAPGTGWEGGGQSQGDSWTCSGTVTVCGTDGKPLTGVNAGVRIKVTMSVTTWDGKATQRSWDDLRNLSDGKGSFSYGGLSASISKGELVTACRFDVLGVDYYYPPDPAIRWDGKTPSLQVSLPGGAAQAAKK